uniref:DoxX family protein n=1 Tax=Pararhizobium sp. IMCC3301 TaxID=3067904 RepID=UPI00274285DF|nr:DoxX family protein [Pararhizobium sp. IMCC3301]
MNNFINSLTQMHLRGFNAIETATQDWLLGLAARLVFAATLLIYFWKSAATKLGDGVFGFLSPSDGAYIQIFPKAFESAGYASSALGAHHQLIAILGMWAEFILPALIVAGLFTRLASLAFIGFVAVMTFVDIFGHAVDPATIGAWFDGNPSSLISDQRVLWVFLLLVLVIKGGGTLSLDQLLMRVRSR